MRYQAFSDSYHTNKTKCTFLLETHTKVHDESVFYTIRRLKIVLILAHQDKENYINETVYDKMKSCEDF